MAYMLGNTVDNERLRQIKTILKKAKVKKYVKEHNKKQIFDEDELDTPKIDGIGVPCKDELYFLMRDLGIPIGSVRTIDSKGKTVNEFSKIKKGEKLKELYLPVNSMKDYYSHFIKDGYVDLIVNPSYMEGEKACHIEYCLEQANNEEIFDVETMNSMQMELVCSAPLKYEKAMAIFNKYFTKHIQEVYIYKYGVDRDRFYKLSGLNKLVKPKREKNKERSR